VAVVGRLVQKIGKRQLTYKGRNNIQNSIKLQNGQNKEKKTKQKKQTQKILK
jgi:hypothetical protein